jgi:hypothetical protein
MMPLNIGRQCRGGWPPLGLGCQSSRRIGSMRAQSSSGTSQMVSRGLGWRRLRGMGGSLQDFPLDSSRHRHRPQERF